MAYRARGRGRHRAATSCRLTFFDKKQHIAEWRPTSSPPGRSGCSPARSAPSAGSSQLTNPQTRCSARPRTDGDDDAAAGLGQHPAADPDLPRERGGAEPGRSSDAIALALDLVEDVPEPLPADVRRGRTTRHRARQALRWIHRPETWAQKEPAAQRLRFDEAFVTQTVLAQRRAELAARGRRAPHRPARAACSTGSTSGCRSRSPTASRRSSREILADLAAGHPMHRLLQGEVGSGKTVVALRAMLRVVDSGGQAALLAPTEVLAQQHHRSITAMLGDLAAGGMLGGADDGTRVALLTGSLGAAARREAHARRRLGRGRHRDRHPRAARGARCSSPTSASSSSTSSTASASSSAPR